MFLRNAIGIYLWEKKYNFMQKINLNKMRIYSHDLSFKLSNLNKKKKLYNSAEKFQFFYIISYMKYMFYYHSLAIMKPSQKISLLISTFSSLFFLILLINAKWVCFILSLDCCKNLHAFLLYYFLNWEKKLFISNY